MPLAQKPGCCCCDYCEWDTAASSYELVTSGWSGACDSGFNGTHTLAFIGTLPGGDGCLVYRYQKSSGLYLWVLNIRSSNGTTLSMSRSGIGCTAEHSYDCDTDAWTLDLWGGTGLGGSPGTIDSVTAIP